MTDEKELKNVIVDDVDFEKQRIENDIETFKNTGKLPDTITSRKFLIQYNNIYECVIDWSKKLSLPDDPVWSKFIDSYIEFAKEKEIFLAADILKQLEKETKDFFNSMSCKTYKFLTTVIKGDHLYNSHIFSLAKELEFVTPKIKYGIPLNATEKFKVSLYINHQVEILENINNDLKKINDIISRYRPYAYVTWSECMYICLQFRSNLDHILNSYVSAADIINSSFPYNQK